MLHYRSNQEILRDMEEYVSGHIEAKKALIMLLDRSKRRHRQKFDTGMHRDFLLAPSKVLLLGASGTGKTHLIESLHQIIDFPLVKVDATKLNPTGASGGIKERDLQELIIAEAQLYVSSRLGSRAEYNSLEGAIDQTVVFIDEIDKLGHSFDSSGNWNSHVQSNFLTLFDNKDEFAGVSFIFAGAFSNITKPGADKKGSLGFNPGEHKESKRNLDDLIVKAGLIPELVGRLTNIIELDKFTIKDYYEILKTRLHPKKEIDLASLGIFDVILSEERGMEIAQHAFESGMGVRALQRQLEKEYLDLEFGYENDLLKIGYDAYI